MTLHRHVRSSYTGLYPQGHGAWHRRFLWWWPSIPNFGPQTLHVRFSKTANSKFWKYGITISIHTGRSRYKRVDAAVLIQDALPDVAAFPNRLFQSWTLFAIAVVFLYWP